MGPTGTGSAAILFCCICVVALSSSMVAVGVEPAVPVNTPMAPPVGTAVVPEKTVVGYGSAVPVKTPMAPPVGTAVVPEKTVAGVGSAVPVKTPMAPPVGPAVVPQKTVVGVGSAVPVKTPMAPPVGPAVVPQKTVVGVGSAVPVTTPKAPAKFISMSALESSNITRKQMPARKLGGAEGGMVVCPVRFDLTRGITAVAGSCRDRPHPSPERCCGALKTYACPYSELINDNEHNGCASAMFYQIIVRGRLRPGIFSQMCVEGPLGLSC